MSSNQKPGAGGKPQDVASPPNAKGEDFTQEEIDEARAGGDGGGGGMPLELTATLRLGGGATVFAGQEGGGVRIGSGEGQGQGLIIEVRATAIIRGDVPQPSGLREEEKIAEKNQ